MTPKFSELLDEYLDLRDTERNPNEGEPIHNRGARRERMEFLRQQLDDVIRSSEREVS